MFQQECEVTCERHTLPWLLMFSVSPGQIPMVLGWEGCHTAPLCIFRFQNTLQKVDGCCWRVLRGASADGGLQGGGESKAFSTTISLTSVEMLPVLSKIVTKIKMMETCL